MWNRLQKTGRVLIEMASIVALAAALTFIFAVSIVWAATRETPETFSNTFSVSTLSSNHNPGQQPGGIDSSTTQHTQITTILKQAGISNADEAAGTIQTFLADYPDWAQHRYIRGLNLIAKSAAGDDKQMVVAGIQNHTLTFQLAFANIVE